jgi:hypothetical protein
MANNLLAQAIDGGGGDRAVKIIQQALGIESDDVANYCFPKSWPTDREQRARIIGDRLQIGPPPGASGGGSFDLCQGWLPGARL